MPTFVCLYVRLDQIWIQIAIRLTERMHPVHAYYLENKFIVGFQNIP